MTSDKVYSTSTSEDEHGPIIYVGKSMPELELELNTSEYGPGRYNYQCFNGHVGAVEPYSEMEQRCIQRENVYLDALILSRDECPGCQEEDRQEQRKWDSYGYNPYEMPDL